MRATIIFNQLQSSWKVKTDEKSRKMRIKLPPDGFIVPSVPYIADLHNLLPLGGWYNQVGVPHYTTEQEADAKSIISTYWPGLMEKEGISVFYRGGRNTGVASVRIGRGTLEGGRFNILCFEPPDHVGDEHGPIGWREFVAPSK